MTKRCYSLDVIKIVATTLIVFHHYQTFFSYMQGRRILFFDGPFYFGYLVELFFLISGFLVYRYQKQILDGLSFRRFFLRRYIRLLPMMALSTVVYAALSWGFFFDNFRLLEELRGFLPSEKPSFWGLLITALGLQEGWGPANPNINNPLWYLSVLLGCYLVFFLLVRLARRLRTSPVYFYAAMTLLGISMMTQGSGNFPFLTNGMARGYYSFFPGLILASVYERRGQHIDSRTAGVCAGVLLLFGLANGSAYGRALLQTGQSFLLSLLIWPALVMLFLWDGLRNLLNHAWIGRLGEIAFDVYVWHLCGIVLASILTEAFFLNEFFYSIPGMLAFTLYIWLFGSLSYFFIEKPLARRIGRLTEKLLS